MVKVDNVEKAAEIGRQARAAIAEYRAAREQWNKMGPKPSILHPRARKRWVEEEDASRQRMVAANTRMDEVWAIGTSHWHVLMNDWAAGILGVFATHE